MANINYNEIFGRYTPGEMDQLRQWGLYPLEPDSEEEPEEIPRQPGHEPFMGLKLSQLDEEQLTHLFDSLIAISQHRSYDLPKAESVQGDEPDFASASGSWIGRRPVAVGRLPSLDEETKHKERELATRLKNIRILKEQIATYAKGEVPLSLLNQKEFEEKEVEKLEPQIPALKKEREFQKQYETELVAVAPIHMALSIAQKGRPTTYTDTLAMCERIMPSLFNDHSLLLGYSGGILARQFQARADLESKKSGQQISAKALIERELKDLKDLAPYQRCITIAVP